MPAPISIDLSQRPKSKNVTVKERDLMRENAFKSAFNIKATIKATNYNDADWNWDMVVMNFKDTLGKNYGLVEFFKPGNDNSTDHVLFEYCDRNGVWVQERFDTYNAAEMAMVNLMKARLRGED